MLRKTVVILALIALFAPTLASQGQKKPKDEVTYQYLVAQFTSLDARMDKLDQHLSQLDSAVAQLKQNQGDMQSELRDNQSTAKTLEASLDSLRLSSAQDLLEVKQDLAQTRQNFADLTDLVKKEAAPAKEAPSAVAAASPAAPAPPVLEGYITQVDDNGISFNLGSGSGVKVGAQFSVYKSSDPHTEVGVIEVIEVVDANNSRAKVVYIKPGIQFEFSDTVRLK